MAKSAGMVRMQKSLREFNREVRKFAADLGVNELVPFHKMIVLELFKRIIEKTPVDTGRASAAWTVALDTPTDESPAGIRDRSGQEGSALEQLARLRPFQTVFIFNNVVYILPLEEGSSKQAPRGMVALSLQEVQEIFP